MPNHDISAVTVLQLETTQQELETLKAYCIEQKATIEGLNAQLENLKRVNDQEIGRVLSESENVIRNLELNISQLTIENAHLLQESEKNAENMRALMDEKSRL